MPPRAMTPDRTKAARELLAFYLEAGVDGALGEQPINHFGPDESAATSAGGAERATCQAP
jgi:uracil-DNA glycosylase